MVKLLLINVKKKEFQKILNSDESRPLGKRLNNAVCMTSGETEVHISYFLCIRVNLLIGHITELVHLNVTKHYAPHLHYCLLCHSTCT